MRKGWKKAVSTMLCAAMILSMSSFMVSADGEPTNPETPPTVDNGETENNDGTNNDQNNGGTNNDQNNGGTNDDQDNDGTNNDENNDGTNNDQNNDGVNDDQTDDGSNDNSGNPPTEGEGPEQPSDFLPMAGLTPATPAAENGIMPMDLPGDGTEGNPHLVSTLEDLKRAVETGGFIQLQGDIDITEASISSTENVTLDLNGRKITAENTVEGRIHITGGNFILQDSAGNGSIVAKANDGGTGVIRVDGGASFVMEDGTIDTTAGTYGIVVFGNASVTVRGGTIKSKAFAISGNGTNTGATNITVSGGMLESEDYAIYHPQKGTLEISDGNIKGAGAIAINQGTLNISGGNFRSTSNQDLGGTPSGDGTANMYGAVINLGAEYGEVTATITGGNFKAVEKGDAITVDQGATNKITLTVNNATIDGNIDVESSTADSIFNFANVDIIGNVTAGEQKVTLTNSTVSGEINGGNIKLDGTVAGNVVATVDGKGYESLEKALESTVGASDKIITLTQDVELDKMLDINVEGVTLDLGGHTITSSKSFDDKETNTSHVINISANNVTVKNGTIKATDKNRHTMQAYKAQNVVLEDLVIDHSGAGKGAPLIVNGSTVTMDGNNSLILNDKSWGGINVDPNGETTASLTFGKGSLSFSGNASKPVVWIEAGEEASSTVSGFENVGLISGPDGTYIMNPNRPTPPTPDTDRPSGSHNTGSSSSSSSNSNVSYHRDPEQDKREAEENMWKRAINKINSARDGSSLKIYTGIVDEIPDYVLDALRENNVTVTFYNQDGDEVTIPAGMAPKSLRDSWTFKQLGNYVLSLDEVVTEVEETTEATQPAAEQTAPTTETAKPNPETGDASSSMMAIAAAAASLCGVVLLSKKNK